MEIRFIKAGEASRCNDFYNRTRNTNRSMEQWRWDFEPSIFETKTIPYVLIEDEGEIVGIQALIPIRMVDSEGVFWTAKSEDTFLDSNYRGKQLFKGMYDLIFEYARDNGLAYIWGFTKAEKPLLQLSFAIPCKTSQIMFPYSRRCVSRLVPQAEVASLRERLKGVALRNACSLAFALSGFRLMRTRARLRKIISRHSLILKTLSEPPADAGEVCHRFVQQWGGKTIYRDTDYLRWRVFDNPFLRSNFLAVYEQDQLVGWALYTIGNDGVGQLVDIIVARHNDCGASSQEIIEVLLAEVALTLRNMGAVALRGWHVNNHPFDLALLSAAKRVGFYHLQQGHAMVIFSSEAAKSRVDAEDVGNWYVSRMATEGTQG